MTDVVLRMAQIAVSLSRIIDAYDMQILDSRINLKLNYHF